MAKQRRTKKQKLLAGKRRRQLDLGIANKRKPKIELPRTKKQESLFSYDVGLIRSDLTKTVLLSILAVATIVVIYLLRLV